MELFYYLFIITPIMGIENNDGLETEITDLEGIRKRQIRRLVGLGFHDVHGLSRDEYSRLFPEVRVQPPAYRGRFDELLFVDPTVDLAEQLKRAYVVKGLNTDADAIKNLTDVPSEPYAVWTHDARRNRGKNAFQLLKGFDGKGFRDDEEGSPLVEVVGKFLQERDYFRDFSIDAVGSLYNGILIPTITTIEGRPTLAAHFEHESSGYSGALSRGRIIYTK